MIKKVLSVLVVIATLAYPFLIFAGFNVINPRYIALIAVPLLLIRLHFQAKKRGTKGLLELKPIPLAILCLLIVIIITNRKELFLYTPAIVNTGLLLTFATSLFGTQTSIIEQFARMSGADLSGAEREYCRKVTIIWCLFFILNIAASLFTVFYCSMKTWVLYNGLVSYILMGLLFSVEFIIRHYRFRKYYGLFTDSIMKKIFPPKEHNEK